MVIDVGKGAKSIRGGYHVLINSLDGTSAMVFVEADIETKSIEGEDGKKQNFINLFQSKLVYPVLRIVVLETKSARL